MLKLYHLWRRKSLYEIHYHLQIDNVRELGVKSAGSLPIRKAYQNMTKINESPNRAGKKVYLTAQGLVDAKAELEFFKNTKRAQVAELIHQAREYGDLAENSEYDAALEEQAMIESRISELENILKGAKVISDQHTEDFVVIGSTVKIEMDDGIDEFTIVGRVEADPSKKRISNESPLGSSLIGAKKGEVVEVATPIVRYKCKILEIK